LLGEHIIKKGMLDPHIGRLVSRMQRDREDADYVAGAVFTDREASALIADAQKALVALEAVVETLRSP
jgi:uncharacterized protein (UPF0332 family)